MPPVAQTLQGLTGGIMLGPQGAQAHRQLMGMILVLTSLLTDTIEPFAQSVAPGHQLLALLGVLSHPLQGFL